MNHKIKLLGNWKVSKLPELIERLKEIHESQLLEIRAALHGRGNLELSQRAKHLQVFNAYLLSLDNEQRRKLFNKFLRFKPKENFVESSDGVLRVPIASRLAKKPGQIKRVRNTKTFTINKRPKI